MQSYIAFLRGINVGGNSMLPMKDLAALCSSCGFKEVRTYINSGNVIFKSNLKEGKLAVKLEEELLKKMGKHITVVIRTQKELAVILKNNPFPKAGGSQVGVLLFHKPLPKTLLSGLEVKGTEELKQFSRELYIYYPQGMGHSKLKLPADTKQGTMRNINTIAKLVEM